MVIGSVPSTTQIPVQPVHPVEVLGLSIVQPGHRRKCGSVYGTDQAHLRMQCEPGYSISTGCTGMNGGGKQSGAVVGMGEDGVHEPPADAMPLAVWQYA